MDKYEQIAGRIFRQYDVDFSAARKGNGWTNRTWLAGGLVLRLATESGTDRIRRELRLASHLPGIVGYPAPVASGVADGYEWSLSVEIPGVNLSEAWPSLAWWQRKREVRRIFEIAQAVHAIDIESIKECASNRAWYSSFDVGEAFATLAGLIQKNILNENQGNVLLDALRRFFIALPHADKVLNHGDLTMDNVIWNDDGIASLLDFEHAAIAPAQLDLYSAVRFCFGPESISDVPNPPGNSELLDIQSEVVRLAKPMLTQEPEFDLLMGFAILISQRRMKIWLENADSPNDYAGWEPYRCLLSLADGQGGYLAPLRSCIA